MAALVVHGVHTPILHNLPPYPLVHDRVESIAVGISRCLDDCRTEVVRLTFNDINS